jgi:hypothetical protein
VLNSTLESYAETAGHTTTMSSILKFIDANSWLYPVASLILWLAAWLDIFVSLRYRRARQMADSASKIVSCTNFPWF